MTIKVEANPNIKNITLKIYSSNGLPIGTLKDLTTDNGILYYNLSSRLKQGIYFFIFNIGDKTITKKVIVK